MNKIRIILSIFLLAIASTALAQQDSAALIGAKFMRKLHHGEKITIVTMGTSLTGGTWRWPDVMLNDWLNIQYPGQVTLYNEGVGASASSVGPNNNSALSGINKIPAAIAHKPDVLFIEFSVNDAYLPYHISLKESETNLNFIIDKIHESNKDIEIILQTMNTVKDKPGESNNASNRPKLDQYVQVYRNVAKARNILLIDHYVNWKELMDKDPVRFDQLVPDRIHPQLPAYREIVLPELKKVLDPLRK